MDPHSPAKVTEASSSQSSLAAPAEIAVPSTPVLSHTKLSPSPDTTVPHPVVPAATTSRAALVSPPPPPSSEMTPPASSQNLISATTPICRSDSISSSFLASPPATANPALCMAYGTSENLPSTTDIDNTDEENLRKLAKDLLSVAQEYRMSATHFKLQHSLLSLTSGEAVKRAEVEQQLARREVEILQSEEYRNRPAVTVDRPRQPNYSAQLEDANNRIKDLEQGNATLERRLRRAKRLIEEDNDKYELLLEENSRLKKRIRDNREHFTLMLDHGSLSSSPRTEFPTPQRKAGGHCPESARSQISRVGSQDPFAALLAADQVLRRDPGSVPSTPARKHEAQNHHCHSRGTHSLSSLPVTPSRQGLYGRDQNRLLTPSHKNYSTPQVQRSGERDRHDRDSTISASDVEEALTDDDVPASQASSLATSMLRRYPGSSQEERSFSPNIGKSSTLLQSKLFGQVKKAGVERPREGSLKRKPSIDDSKTTTAKKAKVRNSFGTGIDA